MRGRIAARNAAYDLALFGAWQGERFAREEKLAPFARYLKRKGKAGGQPRAATPMAMLATFSTLAGAGAPIKIKRLK